MKKLLLSVSMILFVFVMTNAQDMELRDYVVKNQKSLYKQAKEKQILRLKSDEYTVETCTKTFFYLESTKGNGISICCGKKNEKPFSISYTPVGTNLAKGSMLYFKGQFYITDPSGSKVRESDFDIKYRLMTDKETEEFRNDVFELFNNILAT